MGAPAHVVLGDRALNRATLERQLLLRRARLSVGDAVEHLVGLQAQEPHDPYLAMWSRLDGFDPYRMGAMVEQRKLVRMALMRATIHLVTADDALFLRPLAQPVLDAEIARHPEFSPRLVGVDLEPVLTAARTMLAEEALTGAQLRAALRERFPDLDAAALAYACRCRIGLVQVPPRGVWGGTRGPASTPVESWLGRPLCTSPSIDRLVLRYLGAFGPATSADVAKWSRLTGFRAVLDRLRSRLRTFRDGRGREVFDLPDAPRPDPDEPAPARFLPQYDNLLLSHADRSRLGTDDDHHLLATAAGPVKGTVLVDGRVRAVWHADHHRRSGRAEVVVEHVGLSKDDADAVEGEAGAFSRFWHASAEEHVIRLVPLG